MLEIKAIKRSEIGSNACKNLRREGKVPGNIYGNKKNNIHIVIDSKEMLPLLKERNQALSIQLESGEEKVIIKEIQRHPTNDKLIHVDFCRVAAKQ